MILTLLLAVLVSIPAIAAAQDSNGGLALAAGRPIQVDLDQRLTLTRAGQAIDGTLLEPLYVYDRIVVPAGTRVHGHVSALTRPSTARRARAWLGGDFSPHRRLVATFDTFVFADGSELPIQASLTGITSGLRREIAANPAAATPGGSVTGRLKERASEGVADAKARAHEAISGVTRPGRMARLRDAAVNRLPYHRQFLSAGTVLNAELASAAPVTGFGPSPVLLRSGAMPEPGSVVHARLVTALSSGASVRGTPITAVVTQPVISADHRLVVPEGTILTGQVTYAKAARRFRRNGQLRFLFEHITLPAESPAALRASLQSTQTSANDHVRLDEEGGAAVTNPKTRFIAPALAILALRGTFHHDDDHDAVGAPDADAGSARRSGGGGRGLGGFFGFGLAGTVLGRLSRPLGVGFAVVGVARTVYASFLAKGSDVTFARNTPIGLRLAPGPAK